MSAPASPQDIAKRVLTAESDAITAACGRIGVSFDRTVELLVNADTVILTGLGKSGLVAAKIAATFASTGTRAHFVHATEALHGDAGNLRGGDVIVCLSLSGTTGEVCRFASIARRRAVPVIALTGDGASPLAEMADCVLDISVVAEADAHNLAPTASTTVSIAIGDALAVALMIVRGTSRDEFHENHQGGALGERLSTGGT